VVKRTNRGIPTGRRVATDRHRTESYRIKAIDYTQDRDAKIEEIAADLVRKYPHTLALDRARRIVVEHWAAMEQANNVRNTVRSLDMGYDERAMVDRLNDKLNDRRLGSLSTRLPDRLSDVLRGAPDGSHSRLATESHDPAGVDPLSLEAVSAIYDASLKLCAVNGHYDDGETARHWLYQSMKGKAQL
jgi:hypothetical protein